MDIISALEFLHWYRGEFEEALACTERLLEFAVKVDDYGDQFVRHWNMAEISEDRGDFNRQLDEAFKLLELSKKSESGYQRVTACTYMIHALKRSGKKEDKIESECLETIRSTNIDGWKKVYTQSRALMEIVNGELLAEQGDWPRSNEMFESGIELMSRANGGILGEARARGWYAEYLTKQGSKAEAIEQYLKAGELYRKLGNSRQEKWVEEKIASLSMQ
jgi:tetratricopeptide (TPR) repeat protein